MAKLSSCDRDCKDLYYLALYRTSFLITCLEHKIYITVCEAWQDTSLSNFIMDSTRHGLISSLPLFFPLGTNPLPIHRTTSFKHDFWIFTSSCDLYPEFLLAHPSACWLYHLSNPLTHCSDLSRNICFTLWFVKSYNKKNTFVLCPLPDPEPQKLGIPWVIGISLWFVMSPFQPSLSLC